MKGIYLLLKPLMWLVIILALLNGIVTVASSSLVSWVASDALKEQPFRLSDKTQVVINPALLSVDIHDLLLENPQGETIVSADRLAVNLSWVGLLENHLQIDAFSISDAFVYTGRIPEPDQTETLEQQSESTPSDNQKSVEQKQPWTLGLKSGEVRGLTIVGLSEHANESAEINRLTVRNLFLSDKRQEGQLSLEANFRKSDVALSVDADIAEGAGPLQVVLTSDDILAEDFMALGIDVPSLTDLSIVSSPQIEMKDGLIAVADSLTQIEFSELNWSQPDTVLVAKQFKLKLNDLSYKAVDGSMSAMASSVSLSSPLKLSVDQTFDGVVKNFPLVINSLDLQGLSLNMQDGEKVIAGIVDTNITNEDFLKVSVNGSFEGPLTNLKGKANGRIEELSLIDFSAPLAKAVGVSFESGQLNLDTEISLIDNQLDGNLDILMRGIAMKGEKDANVKVGKAMSLNAALLMLKDDNDNVELDIPVSGDVTDPSFGLNSFVSIIVKKAVMSQAKNYLVSTFLPYADIVSIALTGADMLLRVRFEPLEYQPGQDIVSTGQREFMSQMAAMLSDREELQIKLCPVSVPSDIGISGNVESLTKQQVSELMEFGRRRQSNFKNVMVREFGAPSSRLLLCQPENKLDATQLPYLRFEAN